MNPPRSSAPLRAPVETSLGPPPGPIAEARPDLVDASRTEVRRAVEAASRAEAQAARAHRQAMVLSLRAAVAHEEAALLAGQFGLATQADLHEGLAGRARDAVRTEIVLTASNPDDAAAR